MCEDDNCVCIEESRRITQLFFALFNHIFTIEEERNIEFRARKEFDK